jgi:uncharacterized DUF497 family protein
MRFTWDPRKAAANVGKHHVTFEEAVTVFMDPLALVTSDRLHVDRSLIIGESLRQRVLLIVFVALSDEEIRIVSARRATSRERREYEEN